MKTPKLTRSKTGILVSACLASTISPVVNADSTSEEIKLMRQQIQMLEKRLAEMEAKAQRQEAQQSTQQATQQAAPQAVQQTAASQQAVQQAVRNQTDPVASGFATKMTDAVPGGLAGKTEIAGPAAKTETVATAALPSPEGVPATVTKDKILHLGSMNVKIGGFIAGETAYRTVATGADVNTPFRNIPFPTPTDNVTDQGANANQSEFRGTARQSRISMLADGKITDSLKAEVYYESDFLSQPPTANMNQSNSFSLRIRNLYTGIDWMDEGVHLLGGQSWSLATLYSSGLTQRKEKIPASIDSAYVPGFTWLRQWQLRLVKDWNRKYWAGISFENPQTTNTFGLNPGANISTITPLGGSLLNGTANISANDYPDIIIKLAADTDFGHYEIFNLTRNFQSTYGLSAASSPAKQSVWTTAIGGGMVVPLFNKKLEFTASGLIGPGIGRYGTTQLPDATFNQNGSLHPMTGSQFLTSLTWHATPLFDAFAYFGQEKVNSAFGTPASNGLAAESHPATTDDMVFTSFRYYPFD